MQLEWSKKRHGACVQAQGTHGEFNADIGPHGVRLYFNRHYVGLWHSINADIDDLALAKAKAQEHEDNGDTKQWI